jgi:hypothetical protein
VDNEKRVEKFPRQRLNGRGTGKILVGVGIREIGNRSKKVLGEKFKRKSSKYKQQKLSSNLLTFLKC